MTTSKQKTVTLTHMQMSIVIDTTNFEKCTFLLNLQRFKKNYVKVRVPLINDILYKKF